MSSEQPLLSSSSRPSSEGSDERADVEEENLLTLQRPGDRHVQHGRKYGWSFWREVGLFVWAMLATIVVIIISVIFAHSNQHERGEEGPVAPDGKRNMIFMVSDGMGPTSLSMTRSFRQFESGLAPNDVLVLDQYLIGTSRTRSTSSLITDSAAGATAFSCGLKSYNGAISVLPDHSPCGTVLEAAKKAGYLTGLVVTTRITDATPACFAAHVNMRNEEDKVAEQEIGEHPLGRVVDLILGGGRCHFLPNSTDGSCRGDDKDVVALAKDNGFSYIDDKAGFDSLKGGKEVKLPLLGLFAGRDIPYEVDRRSQSDIYPSLDEMAQTALTALTLATKDSDKGFFLMIEGSRIDHAGHANDPVAQVHEVLAYDKAFSTVLKYLKNEKTQGVVVSTSDHETGGLATARQLHASYPEYLWYPGALANATHSAENLAHALRDYSSSHQQSGDLKTYVKETLIRDGLGVTDITDDEVQQILDQPKRSAYTFADIISRRAQIGWSTHGHSAVDVNIYGTTKHSALSGNHENTEVGEFIRDYLSLDLQPITNELVKKGLQLDASAAEEGKTSWKGKQLDSDDGLSVLDHYHGDFKH